MAVTSHVSAEGNQLTIAIKGRFDFAKHQEFRAAYEKSVPKPDSVVVDLKEATYIDSSALGMLLLLRDHVGGDDAQIQVINSSNDVRKTLTISNFNKLFDIK
ncbi:MAG: STAS domain-containing protein [Pseudomonas helleri]|jgi:HptB-dependent secretion and biofilm anti anti-sigma factor|uniref:STAS domain-containing protein n=1 Tax=Pseudomonas helleri TaxID=1608996 RepID=A0A6A7ZDT1_9PSED|nr:STAS domain-containing protein [Pseudomonas helleri]MQT36901.1 STAS domain-containing protein [Pseudomonas helleri]MQU23906.1 STAS domain-containing protein [Pseudomonas helleri]MQU45696.1 STAS domain-containing protein [Pseudomonas helleri]MQU60512.1 STAS domain-containing protein [Pseudomonas helleri]